MKTRLLLLSTLLVLSGIQEISAQPTYFFSGTPTVGNVYPFNNAINQRQYLYYPTDFIGAASGTITAVYFRSSGSATVAFTNVTIKMVHTSILTFTTGPWVTGLTTVFSAPVTSLASLPGDWMKFTLSTPFAYNNSMNLIVEASQTGFSPGFTGLHVTGGVNDRSLYGMSTSITATTQARLIEFGFDLVTICSTPPVPGSTTATPNPTCQGNSVTLNLSGNSIGTGQSYQWQQSTNIAGPYTSLGSPQTTSPYTFVPVSAMFYRCVLTCNLTSSDTSLPLHVTISSPLTSGVSIVNDTNNFCAGTNATFTATPTNGGSSPGYQWKNKGVNVGLNSTTYSAANLQNNDSIWCEMTSSEPCVTSPIAVSNKIPISVISKLSTSVSIAADPGNEICEGDSILFTATAVNGGTSPSFEWKKNGMTVGSNTNFYNGTGLIQSDVIRCEMSSSESCVTLPTASAQLSIVVNASPPMPVIYINGLTLISSVMAFQYQWYINGVAVPGGTNQTILALDSGWYSVTLINENGCSTSSNKLFMKGTVGIDENQVNNDVSIFPSPFRDKIFVVVQGSGVLYQTVIRNIAGQVVYRNVDLKGRSEHDLSKLENGMYFISVLWQDKQTSWRIIKQ